MRNVEFFCPHLNRMVKEQECYDMEETPLCKTCTSEIDANRKALYDWVTAEYGNRFDITMKEDGIEIIVHDRMKVLADPGDEYEGTYLGVECGEAGGTHTHPYDMQLDTADLLEGRRVVGLEESFSGFTPRILFEQEPDQLNEWDHLVDAEGFYTPEEYAAKLGVMLLAKELRFHCPAEEKEITESDCKTRRRRWRKGKICRACKREARQQAAVEYIAEKLLPHCGLAQLRKSNDKPELYLTMLEGLRIDLAPTGLDSEGHMEIHLDGRSFTHDHPTGREMLQALIPFLQGSQVLVLSRGRNRDAQAFVTLRELRDDWQELTKGSFVRICDRLGVWEKEAYRGMMTGAGM